MSYFTLPMTALIGDTVINMQDEKLGKIEDIMLDVETGRVAYAVLSFGGFLGVGDKLFAVPWQSFQIDRDKKRFVLDVDKERLQNAPGFDKDDWPDSADQEFLTSIYDYYHAPLFR